MIFNSAGHHFKDSGAVGVYQGKQIKEADVAILLRNSLTSYITSKGYKVIEDNDTETLSQYLTRIKTGSGSVVVEHHLNAAVNKQATGVEVVVKDNATKESIAMAEEVARALARIYNLPLRNGNGVISERQSHRGKLALVNKAGTSVLIEHGFISNEKDITAIMNNIKLVGEVLGNIVIKYENLL